MTECDHILGLEEGVGECWLVYKSKGWKIGLPSDSWNEEFTFCPLCGEKLD